MVETIKYEGVHPVVVCLLNLIFLGGTGYFALGQKRKAIGAWLYTLVLWLVLLGWIPQIIFAIDGYKVLIMKFRRSLK